MNENENLNQNRQNKEEKKGVKIVREKNAA